MLRLGRGTWDGGRAVASEGADEHFGQEMTLVPAIGVGWIQ